MPNKSLSLLSALMLTVALIGMPVMAQEANTNLEAPKVLDEASRALLEKELNDVSTDSKQVVNFPNRPTLGSLELAPLPGVSESIITGPSSMERSVSPRDLPSEQLLGRITSEVFQEMADLERGNIFLKLQTQKETLKNDLEKLKATYRQARLDEIAKREEVVRSRIKWWQEQEKIRLEAERKKEEAAALEQKIAEAEALREQLRAEAIEKAQANADAAAAPLIEIDPAKTNAVFSDLYILTSIKGTRGVLKAQLRDLEDDSILTVSVDDRLPSGHIVKKITKDAVFVVYGDNESSLVLAGPKKVSTPTAPADNAK